MYNLDTYDYATCMHFHYPLNMTISTCLQLVVNYASNIQLVVNYASHIQLVVPLSCHNKYYTFTFFVIIVQLFYY
jgi:hypothetical protein